MKLKKVILSVFISLAMVGCNRQSTINENVQITHSNIEIDDNQVNNINSEKEIMCEKLIGQLLLNDNERNKIFDIVSQIIDVKNTNIEFENNDLNVLNNSVSSLLNNYTEEKIVPHEKDIDNIKKYMDIYKKMHDSNITECSPASQIREFCIYDIIDGEDIKKNDSFIIKTKNTPEFERKSIDMWEYIKKILPREALKNIDYFQTLYTTKESDGVVGGGLSQKDGKYTLSVNVHLDSTYIPYILYHEYGHYLSLNASQSDSNNSWDYEQKYDDIKFKDDSYMKKFYDKFYKYTYNDMISDTSGYLFYLRHKNEFVSIYAASHYYDDFAESFACFISNDSTETGKEKIEFFNGFPEIIAFKNEAQDMLKSNRLIAEKVTH